MPKRSSKEPDPNKLAKSIVDQATSEDQTDEDTIRRVMREMGRKGGLKGGKARAQKLSARKRREIASKAARTRWKNSD